MEEMGIRFNARTDNGVAGWLRNGQPVRLKEVATPHRVQEHRNWIVLMELNLLKLRDELKEVQ